MRPIIQDHQALMESADHLEIIPHRPVDVITAARPFINCNRRLFSLAISSGPPSTPNDNDYASLNESGDRRASH